MQLSKLLLIFALAFCSVNTFSNVRDQRMTFMEKRNIGVDQTTWMNFWCLKKQLLHSGQCLKMAIMNMKRISYLKPTNKSVPKVGKSARKYFKSETEENIQRKSSLNKMRIN